MLRCEAIKKSGDFSTRISIGYHRIVLLVRDMTGDTKWNVTSHQWDVRSLEQHLEERVTL
jgi:hypothetical protein